METLLGHGVEELTATLHKWLAYAMQCVAAVHVAAVGKRRWIGRHDVLRRMSLGRRGADG